MEHAGQLHHTVTQFDPTFEHAADINADITAAGVRRAGRSGAGSSRVTPVQQAAGFVALVQTLEFGQLLLELIPAAWPRLFHRRQLPPVPSVTAAPPMTSVR